MSSAPGTAMTTQEPSASATKTRGSRAGGALGGVGRAGVPPKSRVWGWVQDAARGSWRMISSRERSPAQCRAATRGKWRPTCHHVPPQRG